jgi:hypothetical protein
VAAFVLIHGAAGVGWYRLLGYLDGGRRLSGFGGCAPW